MAPDPLNAGSLEGDPKFLLGQIAALLRELPGRMDKLEKSMAEGMRDLKLSQDALSAQVQKNTLDQEAKIHDLEKKQHFVAGAWAALAAIGTGVAAYFRGHF